MLFFAIEPYSEDWWFIGGNVGDATPKTFPPEVQVCAVQLEWRVISAFVDCQPINFKSKQRKKMTL